MSAGREAAFEALVAEHRGTVLRVCRSIVRDDHLGADAAQETFLRLWEHLAEDRTPRRSGGWLRSVAVTTSLDLLRRRRARGGEAEVSMEADPPAPAADSVQERELAASFERALATLSEGQRTVFLLRHAAGLPLSRVAETLGVALPTARTQFARACLKLQAALRPFAPGDPTP